MSIFNRVKSAIKSYLSTVPKRWVLLYIGWFFLACQIITLFTFQPWDLMFMVLAWNCFAGSMSCKRNTYFCHAKD